MDTRLNLVSHDIAALVRYKVSLKENKTDFKPKDVDTRANYFKASHATLRTIWPMCGKKQHLRHSLLSALLGRPINSQSELKVHEIYAILEVLNDKDYSIGSGSRELQELLEGDYFGNPWDFPAVRPTGSDVRDVLEEDERAGSAYARSADIEGQSYEECPF